MTRLTDVRSQLNQRGKLVVGFGADLVEWSAEKSLAVAGDIASFAVAQIRLPVEVEDFAEYRTEVQGLISGFGETLKEHGQDYVGKLRDLPGDFRDSVKSGTSQPSRKTTMKKKARKKAAARKTVARKTAANKAA